MTKTHTPRVFPERDIRDIEVALSRINNLLGISWEFRPGELEVIGLLDGGEPVTFGHSKSAMAFLDGFLEGYNVGRDDDGDNDEV